MSKKPYMRIETKEEFDRLFHKVYFEGKQLGFEEGQKYALSIILESIYKHFSPETLNDVEYIIQTRKEQEFFKKMEEKNNVQKSEEVGH